ncbi:MAG: hypothetical protein AAF827_10960 [Cyanobacteria bacterium P01_D01_bin.6]
MSDLRLLSLEEQWQLLSYLVNQLRAGIVEADQAPSKIPNGKNATDVDEVLQATQGCWGNMSIADIDADLDRQRQFDWEQRDIG